MPTNVAIDQDLLERAVAVSGERTKTAAVKRALEEFIERRQQDKLVERFGTLERDPEYDYKAARTVDYRVVSVEAPEHLRLRVRFRDGLTGEVIFKKSHLRGVFAPLTDPAFFAQASCANGFVEWPGEIDLAPDAMHEEILANGKWTLD